MWDGIVEIIANIEDASSKVFKGDREQLKLLEHFVVVCCECLNGGGDLLGSMAIHCLTQRLQFCIERTFNLEK